MDTLRLREGVPGLNKLEKGGFFLRLGFRLYWQGCGQSPLEAEKLAVVSSVRRMMLRLAGREPTL